MFIIKFGHFGSHSFASLLASLIGQGLQLLPVDGGSMSMWPSSEDLRRLNSHPKERGLRHLTTAIGFQYKQRPNKMCFDDGMATIGSTTGAGLGFRNSIPWVSLSRGIHGPMQPHGDLQLYPHIAPAFDLFVDAVLR